MWWKKIKKEKIIIIHQKHATISFLTFLITLIYLWNDSNWLKK
jgi:hypothetical protein